MDRVIGKHGQTKPGATTVTLERDRLTFVVKSVPARLCGTCGEAYLDDEITSALLRQTEDAARVGTQVEIRESVAA
jgi:YgiT-type zinc finger domain-containing protein